MPKPKNRILDSPPSASPSSSEEEDEKVATPEAQSEEAESSEEESSDEEEDRQKQVSGKNPLTPVHKNPTCLKPQPSSSVSESLPDSEESSVPDSVESQQSPTASAFTIKPVVQPKPPTPISKPPAKRPLETAKNEKDVRRKKGKAAEESGLAEQKKSPLISRVWSDDDVIALLQGMIDYRSQKGEDPQTDLPSFIQFMEGKLHFDVSKSQMYEKIRKLRLKYTKIFENGEEPTFSKPHECKAFELARKIWGSVKSNGVEEKAKSDGAKAKKTGNGRKAHKSANVNSLVDNPKEGDREEENKIVAKEVVNNGNTKSSAKVNNVVDTHEEEQVVGGHGVNNAVVDDKKGVGANDYPFLDESLGLMPDAVKNIVKGNDMIGTAQARELEEQWKNLRKEEVKLFLQRLDLMKKHARLVLEAMEI